MCQALRGSESMKSRMYQLMIASLLLIHPLVHLSEEGFRVTRVELRITHRDADLKRLRTGAVEDIEATVDFRHGREDLVWVLADQQRHELITSIADRNSPVRKSLREDIAHHADRLVPHAVTVVVVDLLEVIDIHHDSVDG